MPDKSPTLLQPAASFQLGFKLVEIRMLLTTKSWEKVLLMPKTPLFLEGVLTNGTRDTALQPAQHFGY